MYIILLTVAFLLTIHLLLSIRRPSRYPPGPTWLPVVGNLFQLKYLTRDLGYQHLAFYYLTKQYESPIIGLKLGSTHVVVVHGYENIRQILTRSEFDGRPNSFFMRLRCFGEIAGIMADYGPLWQKRRNFVIRHLKDLGLGKQVMETLILEEVNYLINKLNYMQSNCRGGVILSQYLSESILNVLWMLTSGKKFSQQASLDQDFFCLMQKRSKAFDFSGGLLNIMPWLRYVIPDYIGYSVIVKLNTAMKNFLQDVIDTHQKSYDPLLVRDLIDAVIHEMKMEKNQQTSIFDEHQLLMICMDLFIAGSQTTSSTLEFAFLLTLLHPDKQQKIHAEIDNVIGKHHSPSMSHRLKMPYTEAFIQEVMRMYTVVPINGPRRVLEDTTICDYFIPKDTTILYNTWSVHMDEEYWKDPYIFRPERFINENGTFVTDERVMPYGLGKRRCLGEMLARNAIFLFFVRILQKFQLKSTSQSDLPSCIPRPGLSLSPQPFSVLLESRQ